jgi:8-oxo-dGTP pyrophosphatase MutT (NUDIX family)
MTVEVVWTILRQENRFLLAQKSVSDTASGTWVFPGGKVDPDDQTPIDAAARELKEKVGLEGGQFKLLCSTRLDQYRVQVFCCEQWSGKPKPACDDIIGIGWFTLAEIHALGPSLAPFVSHSLIYLSYLVQHYDNHPDEWHEQWRKRDENG